MSRSIILAVLLTVPALFGQSTWNGLTFGSTLSEVRELLAQQRLELERSDVPWVVKPGWDFKPPGVNAVLHFAPRLFFSEAERLEQVVLGLKDDSGGALGYVAATSVHEQLVAKYGAPATETQSCTAVKVTDFVNNSHKMDCTSRWKVAGQAVTFQWTYWGEKAGDGKISLEIIYTPAQGGF